MPIMGLVHVLGASRGILDHHRGQAWAPIHLAWIFAPVSFVLAGTSVLVLLGYLLEIAETVYLVGMGWSLLVAITAFLSLLSRGDA